jgi:tRNA 5-methylaminomethyl-2-thiouridine biosynthesis bifunctional protein
MNIPPLLLNARYNDRYFDVVNALSEAKQLHIRNARIVERVGAAARQEKPFKIGETGFGAGRLLVALLNSLDAELPCVHGSAAAIIDYDTVEMYPISAERMERILSIFKDQDDGDGYDAVAVTARSIRAVVDAYSRLDVSTPGPRAAVISGANYTVNLNLRVGEAMEMVESLSAPRAAWFLDGHAPKKNPDIWRPELMSAIGRKTAAGGTATAFTVAGRVRRALSAAGFSVEKVAGCGGKKEALLAVFRGDGGCE